MTFNTFKQNVLNREDGPAIEWAGGSKHWFLNDNKSLHSEYKKCIYCHSNLREDSKGHCINCGSSVSK